MEGKSAEVVQSKGFYEEHWKDFVRDAPRGTHKSVENATIAQIRKLVSVQT